MSFVEDGPVPWPVPPDWSDGMRESLAWLTEILRAKRTGHSQHRALRLSPRRGFEFDVVATEQQRRVVDTLVFDRGVTTWALPIWPDVQRLTAPHAAAASTIACRTVGFDFSVGGQAMLWRGVNQFEVVTVAAIAAEGLTLAEPLLAAWPAGTQLYPVRPARLVSGAEERAWNDVTGKRRVSFQLIGPNDWPAVAPTVVYRGFPVLEHRPEESTDPTSGYDRAIEFVDQGTGAVAAFDMTGLAQRTSSHRWLMHGRAEQTSVRSLLYALQGRFAPVWVPSWSADLQLMSNVSAASSVVTVEWCGYTLFGRQQVNRRDIRIELKNGTAIHRRIVGSIEVAGNEQLTFDAPLGIAVTPAQIRCICFMTLCTLASDEVEIEHETDADGVAICNLNFQAVADEL